VVELERGVGPSHHRSVVGRDDERHPGAREFHHRVHHVAGGGAVQLGRRLVGHHDRRAAHQDLGDRGPLLLATRELRG
jgi:hypothetical protein